MLPGTGGLTRLVDKRQVRRDLADVFCTRAEGVRGRQAADWGLVDSVVPRRDFAGHVRARALARAAGSRRPGGGPGVALPPLERTVEADRIRYPHLEVGIDRELATATLTVSGPADPPPATPDGMVGMGAAWWPLALCRALDDAILHLRFNEPEVGTWVWRSTGDTHAVLAADDVLRDHRDHWLAAEIVSYWRRTLKRLDVSSRTLVTLVEPGSCFAGTLAELVLAADRSYMLDGTLEDSDLPAAVLVLTEVNDGWYPMANGLSRLQSRFWGHDEALGEARRHTDRELPARAAAGLGLVTFAPDDIDWDDEIRLMLEERAASRPTP